MLSTTVSLFLTFIYGFSVGAKYLVYIGFALCALVLVLLFLFQRKIIYVPHFPSASRTKVPAPQDFGYLEKSDASPQGYEVVSLLTPDGVELMAYWMPYASMCHAASPLCSNHQDQSLPIILYFHANAGNLVSLHSGPFRTFLLVILFRAIDCLLQEDSWRSIPATYSCSPIGAMPSVKASLAKQASNSMLRYASFSFFLNCIHLSFHARQLLIMF